VNRTDVDLVKLYNRLSYYFCNKEKCEELHIDKNTTIEDLQNILDKYYEDKSLTVVNKKFNKKEIK